MEGAHYIKTKHLLSLSEQQLVDCSRGYGNHGCNGGWVEKAFDYAYDKGLETESSYPYHARDGSCYCSKSRAKVWDIDWFKVKKYNVSAIKSAL